MSEKNTDLDAVGGEILLTARNELYLNLPYLDVVLCGLVFQPGKDVTLTLATDGQTLYYNGNFLAERYLRGRVLCNRAYLHVILHCMLRHLHKKYDKVPELWDLACDVAVESILDELHYPCLELGPVPIYKYEPFAVNFVKKKDAANAASQFLTPILRMCDYFSI